MLFSLLVNDKRLTVILIIYISLSKIIQLLREPVKGFRTGFDRFTILGISLIVLHREGKQNGFIKFPFCSVICKILHYSTGGIGGIAINKCFNSSIVPALAHSVIPLEASTCTTSAPALEQAIVAPPV